MQVLPFVQVSDLPIAASFYAAVTQPLGLKYISAAASSIVFGEADSPTAGPVFEVKKCPGADYQPLQPCRLVLSAKSPSIVSAFHSAALRANPETTTNYLHIHERLDCRGESRAKIGDPDGNIMEVVHLGYPDHSGSQAGSVLRRTQSNSQTVGRVLDWDLDVPMSTPSRSIAGSTAASSRASDNSPFSLLQKGLAAATAGNSPRENSRGYSTGAVVGTVLGVAVGAAVGGALTYTMMKSDRERTPQQYEMPPAFPRRSTFPDQYPDNRSRYVDDRGSKRHQYPPSSYGYSQAGGVKNRMIEELDDRASQHSSHYTTGSRSRGHSEASSTRRPLMIADAEHRSSASSKYSDSPKLLADADRRSNAGSRYTSRRSPESEYRSHSGSKHTASRPRDAEVETYVSARSEKSASTLRAPYPSDRAGSESVPRSRAPSKAGSRYSSATIKPSASHRAPSHASARHVPQPESSIGDDDSAWDDDAGSVAPSDSISNVGVRHSRRSHYV
ncbi:hypothetical protein AAE478_010558 [Parahypoxylon ruwenzoriense]